MRRARTSAKEGSLFALLCVQSSACFSSIVGDAGGVGRGRGERRRLTRDGDREGERVTTHFNVVAGKLRVLQPRTTATAYDHHTFEGCRRWQKLSLPQSGKFEYSAVRLRQPLPEHGPPRFAQPTCIYVADGPARFQEFHPIRLPND